MLEGGRDIVRHLVAAQFEAALACPEELLGSFLASCVSYLGWQYTLSHQLCILIKSLYDPSRIRIRHHVLCLLRRDMLVNEIWVRIVRR